MFEIISVKTPKQTLVDTCHSSLQRPPPGPAEGVRSVSVADHDQGPRPADPTSSAGGVRLREGGPSGLSQLLLQGGKARRGAQRRPASARQTGPTGRDEIGLKAKLQNQLLCCWATRTTLELLGRVQEAVSTQILTQRPLLCEAPPFPGASSWLCPCCALSEALGNRRQEHGTEPVTQEPAAGLDADTGRRRTLWWPRVGRKRLPRSC